MTAIRIGVHVYEDPERLRATLDRIRRHTTLPVDLVLLPDGADAATQVALARMSDVRQSATREPRGTAAVFNRLAAPPTDVIVLLESGCLVTAGWLEALLGALEDPATGLAGPTTNVCWNEQGAFPDAGGSEAELLRSAEQAVARFGSTIRTLEPLHSLADFCYAVRRDVIDAVGAADESYGLGPCWEMDYNVRAARAGFRGVWAPAAYVHRSSVPVRRRIEEARRFTASKRRYQDKFCGLRLQGRKSDYREHCRGDACPNFAPASLIAIRHPVAPPRTSLPGIATGEPAAPLVSCIMPTCDRRSFIPAAVAGFLGQDYPNLELIVIDDGADAIGDILPADRRITYVRLAQRLSVGAKRNLACERARGEFIVHWDDDDWYPAARVRLQVAALVDRGADVCGTSVLYYYDRANVRAFCYRYTGGGLPWVAGNTLAYRRDVWRRRPFADVQVGEDAQFVWGVERLADLRDPTLCVASLHASNVSAKNTAGMFWSPESVDVVRRVMDEGSPASPLARVPLVSCIMPTFNRRPFIHLALECFREQTYANRELIVIDDGKDAIGDLLRDEPAVRYVRVNVRLPIGAKRNRAVAEARGDIVAHWDDDDWYAPDRLERQVAPILRAEADITGLENRFVLQMPDRRFWTVDPRLHRSMFVGDVHGGTLVFRRALWSGGVRYPEIDLAEDAALLQQALARGGRLLKLENLGSFVYMRHSRNAWRFDAGSFLDPGGWRQSGAPEGFTRDRLDAYAAASSQLCA
jgi:glycosyltransferase involved in cell wall biosynthesis